MDTWTFIFLMVMLKIPIAMLLGLVWWAVHATPEAEAPDSGEGGSKRPLDPHPRSPRPRPARRGPHAGEAPPAPDRVRSGGMPLGDEHRR